SPTTGFCPRTGSACCWTALRRSSPATAVRCGSGLRPHLCWVAGRVNRKLSVRAARKLSYTRTREECAIVATRTGLSAAELERIRDSRAAGGKPKVVFTEAAGQIAGQVGQVVELTDPQLSDEWLVVRFGRDELPFSPSDLAIAPKTAPAKRPADPPFA